MTRRLPDPDRLERFRASIDRQICLAAETRARLFRAQQRISAGDTLLRMSMELLERARRAAVER